MFKDVNGETLFSLPNQTAGYSATAQTYGFDPIVEVRSVDFKIDSNNGSTYTGVAEVAFETSDFTILENSPVDTVITTINATDPENDSLTFSISAGNPDINDNGIPAFSIEADTGNLKVNDPEDLNFETQASFDLAISVSDGQNSDTKVATVYLNDVSNGEPVIDSIDNVSLTPDVVAGDVIVSAVNVTDSNTPIENITFSLSDVPTDATDAPFFSIDSNTGEITLTEAGATGLDFSNGTVFYDLGVTASDGTNPSVEETFQVLTNVSEASVELNLLDENGNEITDNTILGDTFSVEVLVGDQRETNPVGVMALTYNLANDELLQVNPETGEIIGTPQLLTKNSNRFNISISGDIAVNSDNEFYLVSDASGVHSLDINTGELSFVGFTGFNYPGNPYNYGGITFADSADEDNFFLTEANHTEEILKANLETQSNQILFSNIISSYNAGATDLAAKVTIPPTSDLVRPAFPDTTQFFDITNTGTGALDILNISSIDVNHSSVSLDPESVAGDIVLNPGESHRVFLTYAPEAAGEDFDLADALVIHSDAVNDSSFDVALAGKSTYDSDISYDGTVNLEDLAVLEQLTFPSVEGDGNYHRSADVNGDGKINRGELIPLNFELFETIN